MIICDCFYPSALSSTRLSQWEGKQKLTTIKWSFFNLSEDRNAHADDIFDNDIFDTHELCRPMLTDYYNSSGFFSRNEGAHGMLSFVLLMFLKDFFGWRQLKNANLSFWLDFLLVEG